MSIMLSQITVNPTPLVNSMYSLTSDKSSKPCIAGPLWRELPVQVTPKNTPKLHYWSCVWGIHQLLVDSQCSGPVMLSIYYFPFLIWFISNFVVIRSAFFNSLVSGTSECDLQSCFKTNFQSCFISTSYDKPLDERHRPLLMISQHWFR